MAASDAKVGARFGRLTIVAEEPRKEIPSTKPYGPRTVSGPRMWRCRCDCGAEVVKPHSRLAYGMVQSCGCLRSERATAQAAARFDRPPLDGSRVAQLREESERGRWFVYREIPSGLPASQRYWLCMCKCGTVALVRADRLASTPTADEKREAKAANVDGGVDPIAKLARGYPDCGCSYAKWQEAEFRRAESGIAQTRRRVELQAERSKALIDQYGLDIGELEKLREVAREMAKGR